MPQSFDSVLLHLVFSTKGRQPLITDSVAPKLHAYLAKVCQEMGSQAIIVNGMADHVHILCSLSRTVAISDLVERVKKRSSKWIKTLAAEHGSFQWQPGYGVFSIGKSNLEKLKSYIRDQPIHHRKHSYKEEFLALLRKYGVEPDEAHMWD